MQISLIKFLIFQNFEGDTMKFKNLAIPSLIIILILISLSMASAEEICDGNTLNIEDDDVLIESDSDIGDSGNDFEETDFEDFSNDVKSKNILKSSDDILEIDYPQTHDESHNIVVDAKASSNKGKVGDSIKYTITVTNNNPFTVHALEVFSPEDPDHFYLSKQSTSNDKINVGLLDETAWLIEKLGPGETLVINTLIKIESAGKSELSLSLSHNYPPYEEISYDEDTKNSSKSTEKLNSGNKVKEDSLNLSTQKTANPLFLLILSISSILILNMKNRRY